MKATELRIGNWFEYNGLFLKVDGIRPPQPLSPKEYADKWLIDCDMSTLTVPLDECKPIPLTEEWLERFNWNPPKDIGVSFSLTTDEIHFVAGNYYKKIKYVHQLQNLFYCLCGEELELKA